MAQEKYVAYVGTYTHENSVGIHIYDVDVTKGYMTERKVVPINNPSDLVVSKNRKFLYSIADEGVQSFRFQNFKRRGSRTDQRTVDWWYERMLCRSR